MTAKRRRASENTEGKAGHQPEDPNLDSTLTLNPVIGISPTDLLAAGGELLFQVVARPASVVEESAKLWQELAKVAFDRSELAPAPRDRRFADPAWSEQRYFKRAMQAWMAWQRSLGGVVDHLELDQRDEQRARFLVQLLSDAYAPSNFLLGNPGALRQARETGGRSVVDGLSHFLEDLRQNGGLPQQVDKSAFRVGENLATTPGAVVFRNELAELIQYRPTTSTVFARPCVIVPPQINKYYIYDLSPEKSFVRHAVEQGFQVFAISWRNPTAEQRDFGLDDYVETVELAIDVAREITGQDSVNGVGACAGGITFAATLGYLEAAGEADKVASTTLMVNVLVNDPSDSEIALFANDRTIEAARKRSARKGILDGQSTARIFSWMRPNDLIWNYVVSNYLMGGTPPAFDILYWNNDTTNLPARLHSDFLDIFRDNPLREADALVVRGKAVDLERVESPVYVTGGTTDHITPWQACYRSTQLFGGEVTYVLSTAGHIQSIVNPPATSRRKYLLNPETPPDPEAWLADAEPHDGSWWTHWYGWLARHAGKKRKARKKLGNKRHPELEPAPGTYVFD